MDYRNEEDLDAAGMIRADMPACRCKPVGTRSGLMAEEDSPFRESEAGEGAKEGKLITHIVRSISSLIIITTAAYVKSFYHNSC